MYRISLKDEVIQQTDEPRFVKVNPLTGIWIQCNYNQAECVAINCKRYSIEGKPPVEDAPDVVSIKYVDNVQYAVNTSRDVDLLCYALRKIVEEITE